MRLTLTLALGKIVAVASISLFFSIGIPEAQEHDFGRFTQGGPVAGTLHGDGYHLAALEIVLKKVGEGGSSRVQGRRSAGRDREFSNRAVPKS